MEQRKRQVSRNPKDVNVTQVPACTLALTKNFTHIVGVFAVQHHPLIKKLNEGHICIQRSGLIILHPELKEQEENKYP
jgi:hypothetical protein